MHSLLIFFVTVLSLSSRLLFLFSFSMNFQSLINHPDNTLKAESTGSRGLGFSNKPSHSSSELVSSWVFLSLLKIAAAPLLLEEKSTISSTEHHGDVHWVSFIFGGRLSILGYVWKSSTWQAEVAITRLFFFFNVFLDLQSTTYWINT